MKMAYSLGKPKDLDSITKEDVLESHIWIWVWEAGLEGEFEEDYQVPVLDVDDIGEEFTEPIITLQVEGTDVIASGSLSYKEKRISGIAVWENDSWQVLTECSLEVPISFQSLVKINGKEGMTFILHSKESDEAFASKR